MYVGTSQGPRRADLPFDNFCRAEKLGECQDLAGSESNVYFLSEALRWWYTTSSMNRAVYLCCFDAHT